MQPEQVFVEFFGQVEFLEYSEHDALLGTTASWHLQFCECVTVFSFLVSE